MWKERYVSCARVARKPLKREKGGARRSRQFGYFVEKLAQNFSIERVCKKEGSDQCV
jgi:hypothetical protein